MHLEIRPWAAQYLLPLALAVAAAVGISACGGGGGGGETATTAAPAAPSTATPAPATAMSSGVITAFGSVFVNGRRFRTESARVIDDDTGTATAGPGGLEAGMVVDVRHHGSGDAAEAEELHIHPLARGFVDAVDATAGTVTVMGQVVRVSSATLFSDRRSCTGAPAPCPVVVTVDGLAATTTTVSGTATTPGSYVTVHGFLFDSTSADIVATLVAVSDPPTGPSLANFKAEGVATVSSSGVSINGLALDLSHASCLVDGRVVNCTGAFTDGAVVSAGASAAPARPTSLLVADFARQLGRVPVEAAGAAVEIEGVVSDVPGSSTFVVRGMTVDASGLPAGTQLPVVGDEVEVVGTLSASGDTVNATSLEIEHQGQTARLALMGDATNVRPGAITETFTVSVLGLDVTVNRNTRLADRSRPGWFGRDPTVNPLNITTFRAYLAASVSRDVLVVSEPDRLGRLVARSLVILPSTDVSALSGTVDAIPAVVNSQTPNTPTVFFVHGIRVRADPRAVRAVDEKNFNKPTTITAGDRVAAFGTFVAGSIVVGPDPSWGNRVVDFGQPGDDDSHDNGNHNGDDKKDKKDKKKGKGFHGDRGLF